MHARIPTVSIALMALLLSQIARVVPNTRIGTLAKNMQDRPYNPFLYVDTDAIAKRVLEMIPTAPAMAAAEIAEMRHAETERVVGRSLAEPADTTQRSSN